MISLKQPTEPYELDLPYGISVTVTPLTTASMAAAQASARRRIESLETQVKERKESGLPLDGLPDLSVINGAKIDHSNGGNCSAVSV